MPDDWEKQNGLDPSVNDAAAYTLGEGYTNIEHYINSLATKSYYIFAPQAPTATLTNATTARLTWTNAQKDATAIVVEQSEDGEQFTEIQRLAGKATNTLVRDLTAGQLYFFRLKTVTPDGESDYSTVVAVNDEFMRPGGGTPAGTTTFTHAEGQLYRIINYATVPYNSSTNLNGVPKYLLFTLGGSLGATEDFQWDSPSQLWEIIPVDGGFHIRRL
jgi:hypothetical protein